MPKPPHLPIYPKIYRSYYIDIKLEALEFAAKYGDKDAAFCFNTTQRSIQDWRWSENSLKRKAGDGCSKRKRLDGGGRSVKHPELEILLPSWIKEMREKKVLELPSGKSRTKV